MDTRTKQKHLRAVRMLVHALEGHRSSLPAGKTINAVLADGKPAADSPRYRALGNSMAVPVIRWLAKRIAAQEVQNGK